MSALKRAGIDHDEVKPWNWATIAGRTDPVEIVSYPCPVEDTIQVRMIPGDPTTMKTVPVKAIAAFAPDRYDVDQVLEDLAPAVVRGQFNQAIRRLQGIFDTTVEDDIQAARRLIELVYLVGGDRRKKALEVRVERRAS